MGDAGEGLIDADARIQERIEEMAGERASGRAPFSRTAEQLRAAEALQSLKLARSELQRQLEVTAHETRRSQLGQALEELDRRIAEATALAG